MREARRDGSIRSKRRSVHDPVDLPPFVGIKRSPEGVDPFDWIGRAFIHDASLPAAPRWCLDHGNAPPCESSMNSARLTPATEAPTDCEISRHASTRAAPQRRASRARTRSATARADSMLSGMSNVILAIIPTAATGWRASAPGGNGWVCTLKRGAAAPLEPLPIVSRLSVSPTLKKRRNLDGWSMAGAAGLTRSPAAFSG